MLETHANPWFHESGENRFVQMCFRRGIVWNSDREYTRLSWPAETPEREIRSPLMQWIPLRSSEWTRWNLKLSGCRLCREPAAHPDTSASGRFAGTLSKR